MATARYASLDLFLNSITVYLVESHQSSLLMMYPLEEKLTTKTDCMLTQAADI